jgi:DNA-binding NarL/FixJ family response regulator
MRILLADHRAKVRSALRLALEQEPGWEVVAEAGTHAAMLEKARRWQPDVALVDCDLPDKPYVAPGCEVEFLAALLETCPSTHFVAMCARPEMKQEAMSAGASAFVSKGEAPQVLLEVLRNLSLPPGR